MSKKYRVSNKRGIPWALLGIISLAIYLWFTFDTGEYNIYIIVITLALLLIWLANYFRKRNISKQFDIYSNKLVEHFDERTEREDFTTEVNVLNVSEKKVCKFCGASQINSSTNCENCGKNLS